MDLDELTDCGIAKRNRFTWSKVTHTNRSMTTVVLSCSVVLSICILGRSHRVWSHSQYLVGRIMVADLSTVICLRLYPSLIGPYGSHLVVSLASEA